MPVDADGGFVTRAFRPGDEAAILDLFRRSFHLPRSREHFEWKYVADPFGARHISETFSDEGALVGHYAGYVVPFVDRGSALLAHQVGDTMTARTVRHIGRGATSILGRTALHFYSNFCEGRVAFNYGFNVANIQKFSLLFLRSDRVEPVPYWSLDLATKPIAPASGLARAGAALRGWKVENGAARPDELDAFFASVAGDYEFLVRRDAAYVRWRYLDAPEGDYRVVTIRKWGKVAAWAVFRRVEDRIVWGDALFDRRRAEAAELLLESLVVDDDVVAVEGWFSERPAWFATTLARLGFRRLPEPQDLSLMCVPFERADAVSRMREALYYTKGDSDLF